MKEKTPMKAATKAGFALTAILASMAITTGCNPEPAKKAAAIESPAPASSMPDEIKTMIAEAAESAPLPPCSEVATEEQARALLSRLVSNPEYIDFTPLNMGSVSCLLEVELLADAADPSTRGFFYVLPDGEHGLNGPLIDRRNTAFLKPATASSAITAQEGLNVEAIKIALDGLKERVEAATTNASALTSVAAPPTAPAATATPVQEAPAYVQTPAGLVDANSPFVAAPGKTLQQTMLADLKQAPHVTNVQTVNVENPVAQVYVLYDSTCQFCAKLYDMQDAIAEKHNVSFNWIPGYISDMGWLHAAHAVKELAKSPEAGLAAVREAFTGPKPTAAALEELAAGLTQQDFENAKHAAVFLYRLNKMSAKPIGTPLLFIEGLNGGVSTAYGAVEDDAEWVRLLDKAAQ